MYTIQPVYWLQIKVIIIIIVTIVRQWMAVNKLKINNAKMVVLVMKSPVQQAGPDIIELTIGDTCVTTSTKAGNLDVIFSEHLDMEAHTGAVCRSAFVPSPQLGGY